MTTGGYIVFRSPPPFGWPKKVSHYQMIYKSYYIILKPVSEIRFILQIKV